MQLPAISLPSADVLIVGLGPGDPGQVPLAVWHALHSGRPVILRTAHHPVVEALWAEGSRPQSCDDLYEAHATFEQVYAAIVERVLAAAAHTPVVYAVPGDPWVGEATTRLLLREAGERGLSVQVCHAGSFIEPGFAAVQVDPMDGSQVVDAMLLARQHHPQVDPGLPMLVGQLYARWLASDVKLTLLNAYPPEHPVTLLQQVGTAQARTVSLALHELDRRDDFDHLTSLYVPPLGFGGSFSHLQEIVAHLRAPEGCPWDREQTLQSLRSDLLDEACEVLEAIDAEDDAHIAEELGDLLLLVVMLTQIATEEGRFQMHQVTRGIVHKLIRRHPHVFGDAQVRTLDELYANWDAIKAQELAEKGRERSPLEGIPASLPALEKARKLQSKAAKAGLLDREEVALADPRLAALLPEGSRAEDLGRLLWQLVALAHLRGLNPENALREYVVHMREALSATLAEAQG